MIGVLILLFVGFMLVPQISKDLNSTLDTLPVRLALIITTLAALSYNKLVGLAAFLFVLVMFVRNRRLAFFKALAPSLLFFVIYTVAAGAYEGNMGTAFRHKSLILWVVILLLASTIVATKEHKAESKELTG